jgi:hypothetical protein
VLICPRKNSFQQQVGQQKQDGKTGGNSNKQELPGARSDTDRRRHPKAGSRRHISNTAAANENQTASDEADCLRQALDDPQRVTRPP